MSKLKPELPTKTIWVTSHFKDREVNPFKKVATFCKLFCVQPSIKVSITFFLFPTNILSNKVKKYKIIFINSLFIMNYDFLKIFNIVGNFKKKCGHHEKSV